MILSEKQRVYLEKCKKIYTDLDYTNTLTYITICKILKRSSYDKDEASIMNHTVKNVYELYSEKFGRMK